MPANPEKYIANKERIAADHGGEAPTDLFDSTAGVGDGASAPSGTADSLHAQHVARAGQLPPGQRWVPRPVPMPPITVDYPRIDTADWNMVVYGLVGRELRISYEQLRGMPATTLERDIHCVTSWSVQGLRYTGVSLQTFLDLAGGPLPDATTVIFESYDGYTTNVPLADLADPTSCLIVYEVDGEPLARANGGPVRAIIPHLYYWKSAKFLRGIRLAAADERGFWEERGYHNHANPWQNERYSWQERE